MSDTAQCSACGAELSQDATPQGLCAACLLKLGLSSTNIPVDDMPRPLPEPEQPLKSRRRFRSRWQVPLILTGASVLVIALAFFLIRRQTPPQQLRVLRFSLYLPNSIDFAVSPDGRRIAFTAMHEGKTLLSIHSLDSFHDVPLPETEGAAAPFWSPDSRFIGFFARGKLKKVDIGTGAAETLCDAPTGKGGTWGPGGLILFERNSTGGLFRVSDRGGSPEAATKIEQSNRQVTHRWPHFLPDGRHFIYIATTLNGESDGVFIGSLETGEATRVMTGRSAVMYSEESLLFVGSGMLFAQPFNFRSLKTSADAWPVRFAEQIDRFSASTNGILAYRRSGQRQPSPIGWFDRTGKHLGIVESLSGVGQFSISPDGRAVAASRSGDIWVSDLNRGVMSRFTFDPAEDAFPIWSPDGTRIAFLSNRGGRKALLYQKPANATANEELLLDAPQLGTLESWSPDGRFITYTAHDDKGKSTVWVLPLAGDRKPFMVQSAFNLREPRFSPDGRWLTYVSDESGKEEIYAETFPPGGSKWQVSVDGGTSPKWGRDGRELFFLSPDSTLMAVAFKAGDRSLELSVPRPLFQVPRGSGDYDVSTDGQRFLVRAEIEDHTPLPIDVVINWASEIQR